MARIAGVELQNNLKVPYALAKIYGIGYAKALKILDQVKVDPNKRASELEDKEIQMLIELIEKNYVVEGELKQEIFRNIKRLKDIRSYRGLRHKLGLPVRGQKTRANAHTRKGHNMAVGGLKRILEKT
ncbi:MAG: 30S ribosomal protein S13 [bacterium]